VGDSPGLILPPGWMKACVLRFRTTSIWPLALVMMAAAMRMVRAMAGVWIRLDEGISRPFWIERERWWCEEFNLE
jgi:hypothetical protein